MSQTRRIYDSSEQSRSNKDNRALQQYTMTSEKYYHPRPCRTELGNTPGNDISLFTGNLVDLESQLHGIGPAVSGRMEHLRSCQIATTPRQVSFNAGQLPGQAEYDATNSMNPFRYALDFLFGK